MFIQEFAVLALMLTQGTMNLPLLRKGEVVAINGVNWVIRVDHRAMVIDRTSISGDKLNEFVIGGRTILADRAFWDKSETEKRRLNVSDRLSLRDGILAFDGTKIDCGGRRVLKIKGDAISLGDGVAVGVTVSDSTSSDPSFIYLMYIDVDSKKATLHEVIGKMSFLDFIFFTDK